MNEDNKSTINIQRDSTVTKGLGSKRSYEAEYHHVRSDEKNYISLTLKELPSPEKP